MDNRKHETEKHMRVNKRNHMRRSIKKGKVKREEKRSEARQNKNRRDKYTKERRSEDIKREKRQDASSLAIRLPLPCRSRQTRPPFSETNEKRNVESGVNGMIWNQPEMPWVEDVDKKMKTER